MMNVEVQRSSGKREFTGRRSGGVKVVVLRYWPTHAAGSLFRSRDMQLVTAARKAPGRVPLGSYVYWS